MLLAFHFSVEPTDIGGLSETPPKTLLHSGESPEGACCLSSEIKIVDMFISEGSEYSQYSRRASNYPRWFPHRDDFRNILPAILENILPHCQDRPLGGPVTSYGCFLGSPNHRLKKSHFFGCLQSGVKCRSWERTSMDDEIPSDLQQRLQKLKPFAKDMTKSDQKWLNPWYSVSSSI